MRIQEELVFLRGDTGELQHFSAAPELWRCCFNLRRFLSQILKVLWNEGSELGIEIAFLCRLFYFAPQSLELAFEGRHF